MLAPRPGWPDSAPIVRSPPYNLHLLGLKYAQQDRANPAALLSLVVVLSCPLLWTLPPITGQVGATPRLRDWPDSPVDSCPYQGQK